MFPNKFLHRFLGRRCEQEPRKPCLRLLAQVVLARNPLGSRGVAALMRIGVLKPPLRELDVAHCELHEHEMLDLQDAGAAAGVRILADYQ